jgi:polysaccharide biosynthesis transport protein
MSLITYGYQYAATEGPLVAITDFVRLIRERWIPITLLGLLGALGAAGFAWMQAPLYEAHSQLFVSTTTGGDLGQLAPSDAFSQQRVKSYTDLITSPTVLAAVISRLDLAETPDQLARQVTVSSPPDSVLLDIAVLDPSPARGRDIANSIALEFPRLVDRLENPGGTHRSPVTVTMTREAVTATVPISPRTKLDVALGLLVGLGIGLGTGVLLESLDRSVTGRDQAAQIAGAPMLGAVGDDPGTSTTPLITHDPFCPRAEAFRQIRTNIRFLSVDHAVRSMVVTCSVPAEGKTTVAANLALAIAQTGEPVVLVDADLRRPSVADLLGLSSGIGLTSVLIGRSQLWDALQPWGSDLPLQILTSGPVPPNPSELIGSARMAEVIAALTTAGLTVVIDSPPLLPVTDAAVLARATDGALLVVRAGSTHVDQLASAGAALRQAGAGVLGVVLNRVPRRGRGAVDPSATSTYSSYVAPATSAAAGNGDATLDRSAGSAPARTSWRPRKWALGDWFTGERSIGRASAAPVPQQRDELAVTFGDRLPADPELAFGRSLAEATAALAAARLAPPAVVEGLSLLDYESLAPGSSGSGSSGSGSSGSGDTPRTGRSGDNIEALIQPQRRDRSHR